MRGLKDFQRDTVAYLLNRYFGTDPTRRFLVADETGLGKSVVAGGVVAAMIDRLQRDDAVTRIDIIYICSNQDVAAQNLARLAGPHHATHPMSSRLTLLGRELPRFTPQARGGKPVNLVSFTPGTSFAPGWQTGTAAERAMLHHLLRNEGWDGWQRKAALRIMRCTTRSFERFQNRCANFPRTLTHGIDPRVRNRFLDRARAKGLLDQFDELIADIGRRSALTDSENGRCKTLVGRLRGVLAEAGAHALEPDLVILDEFQRFRNLLDPELGGEAAELAHHLFNHQDARVLLLSATPYKPFTYAEEAATDDHHADLKRVLNFLCPDPEWHDAVHAALRAHREAVLAGAPTGAAGDDVRRLLLRVMCRTERPALGRHAMLAEHITPAAGVDPTEIRSFVAMKRLGAALDAPVLLDYWKSAPYFLNFLEGYQLGDRLREVIKRGLGAEVRQLLDRAHLLDAAAVHKYAPIDLGNGKLRSLAAQTVDRGWWRLLWLPPSMPHYTLGPPFADAARQQITKRLLFSSWNATPTAVSALLSYEAERRVRDRHIEAPRSRLDYRMSDGRVASMSTVALFWPHPVLAAASDPLTAARRDPDRPPDLAAIESECRQRLLAEAPNTFRAAGHAGEPQPWRAVLGWPGANPGVFLDTAVEAATTGADPGNDADKDSYSGLVRHFQEALAAASAGGEPISASPDAVVDDLVAIGLHGPGNIAWRALGRLVDDERRVTPQGLWRAATIVAAGLRSLFNRPETMLLLDQLGLGDPYWRAVLRYCAAGGLQAVLDEYVHTLRSSAAETPLDDEALLAIARDVNRAVTVHSAPYSALDPLNPGSRISMTGRFALRYGGRGDDETNTKRMTGVRHAFNSPFWPFVVTTTSAGQEGIDFHTYCSAVVHWNVPANPVDFEQREGRVHRFGGHAVRRNIATRHRADALRSAHPDVWKAAYDAARQQSQLGDMAPYWVYPGPARIERHVLPLPLSQDLARYEQLKRDLALYRLTFGQPRQEDMLALLTSAGLADQQAERDTIDLRPPTRSARRSRVR
ncbi:helicase [Micromonospora sp. WMMC415]|uniref:C-terminal helicase domain-containing protein n=1 Tax=Micromonospora sp. WMMC415 TaxID=2675222 RepID=UPI0012B47203|nr:helicase-related protein [Micromonospora sp. WMMC415]QGN49837.1 helicase [Micromonospora sp. WMMC415]